MPLRPHTPPPCLPPPPFPPGESPYRLKGVAYRGHLTYVEEHVPGGVAAMLDGFHDPAMRAFFEQPFLASVRYDVFPLAVAGEVCAQLCDISFQEFVHTRTSHQARQDINGVYRFLMKLVSPGMIATRIPRLLSQYFDFSSADTKQVSAHHIDGVYHGVPAALSPWMQVVGASYLGTILVEAGHTDARVIIGVPQPDGEDEGIPLVALPFEVHVPS